MFFHDRHGLSSGLLLDLSTGILDFSTGAPAQFRRFMGCPVRCSAVWSEWLCRPHETVHTWGILHSKHTRMDMGYGCSTVTATCFSTSQPSPPLPPMSCPHVASPVQDVAWILERRPPASLKPLTDREKATLESWLASCGEARHVLSFFPKRGGQHVRATCDNPSSR